MEYGFAKRAGIILALVLSFVVLIAQPHTAQAAAPEGAGWIEGHVDLIVRVSPKDRAMTVHGEATLVLMNPSSPGPTLWVNFGRYSKKPVMAFASLTGPPGSTVDLNVMDPKYPGTFFGVVHLAKPARRGDTVQVSFDMKSLRGNAFTLTLADPVSVVGEENGWYPQALADGGKLDADRAKTIGTTTFQIPSGYRSLSNGDLVAAYPQGGDEVESWQLRKPGLRSFAVGPYRVTKNRVAGVPVALYTLRGTDPRKRLKDITDVLTVLQRLYGPFPYTAYSIAEVPDDAVNWYGLASREVSVERTSLFNLSDAQGYFAHEAGHAWWGNLVGETGPGGLMMNEGLAQYSALTVRRIVNGQVAYIRSMNFSSDSSPYSGQGYFTNYFGTAEDKPLSQLDIRFATDYNLAIAKGVWVYHMLRERVGDRAFFDTLRTLIREFAGKEIQLADLRAAFLKAAPGAGLHEFFHEWLDRPGAPVITWAYGSQAGEIVLRQWQAGEPYQLALPIVVQCGAKTYTGTVVLARRLQTFNFRSRCARPAVKIDAASTLLLWRPSYSPTPRLQAIVARPR
jgi:hypothetical protein